MARHLHKSVFDNKWKAVEDLSKILNYYVMFLDDMDRTQDSIDQQEIAITWFVDRLEGVLKTYCFTRPDNYRMRPTGRKLKE